MNTDTTKKVQAAEVTFADDAFSPLPEGALDQDQIARKKTTYFKDVWRNFKKNKAAVISLVVIAIMIFFVLFSGLEQIILDVIFGHACGQEEEYPLLLRF